MSETTPNRPQKRGMRARINANCKDCIYDPAENGTWLQQVADCTIEKCDFWDIRPKPRAVKLQEKENEHPR